MTASRKPPGPEPVREPSPSFAALMDRLQSGDEEAARALHRRYTPGLVALARRQVPGHVQGRIDPESVVQSVYGSFFVRYRDREFVNLGDWNDLWGLLTVITLRKCANRRRFHTQARRDVRRETGTDQRSSAARADPADPEPTPYEAAVLTEMVDLTLSGLESRDRQIIELLLQGEDLEYVRSRVGCSERTVRRVRDRVKVKLRQMG
ncbi:MAG TPA: ECF-type sigma factor [Gemmataceae bacterium]|nr:ECF-type sigma factor [Gemmataceae bacterium]